MRVSGPKIAAAVAALFVAVEGGAIASHWWHNRNVDERKGLYARTAGEGQPVVFIHGLRGSSRYWGTWLDRTPGRQMIYVDILGFGRSPWPSVDYALDEHLSAIRDAVRANAVPKRKVTVVGHSTGAIMALEYARLFRSDVDRVIVLDLPVFDDEDEARSQVAHMSSMVAGSPRALARVSCDLVSAFRPVVRLVAPLFHHSIPADVARDAVEHRWTSFDGTVQNVLVPSNAARSLADLRKRGVPVTIIQGKDDPVTPQDRLRALAQSTGAELLMVDGDHDAYLRNPQAVSALIAARLTARP